MPGTVGCKCTAWRRDRTGYERSCRSGKRKYAASLFVWGGDVSVSLFSDAGLTAADFPHTGPVCRLDEAKAYADSWLRARCAAEKPRRR